jgi:hypothetical protein
MKAALEAAKVDGVVQSNNFSASNEVKQEREGAQSATKNSPQYDAGKNNHDTVAAALAMVAAVNKDFTKINNSAASNNKSQQTQQQQQHKAPVTAGAAALERARSAITAALQNKPNENVQKQGSNGVVPTDFRNGISNHNSSDQQNQTTAAPSAGSAAHLLAAVAARATPSSSVLSSSKAPPPSSSTSPTPQRTSSSSKKKGPPLRRGKWTAEEEAYANRLIQEFKAGLLPLTDGTTLRTFLSKLLNCDPMRISKKFVGSNCIGKQVFRRRTADINRLTPDQIQQSRAELSDLERRFLERVTQTNRAKSSNVGAGNSTNGTSNSASVSSMASKVKMQTAERDSPPPTPPWLRPPKGYTHGTGAATAASALSGNSIDRSAAAAAAGRALLQGSGSDAFKNAFDQKKNRTLGSTSNGNAGLLALAALQQRKSQQSLLNLLTARTSTANLLAAAANGSNGNNENSSVSGSALAQIARNASAAKLAGLAASNNSMTSLMLKAGLSRDQLHALARENQLNSSSSLSNMLERQSSFDALMSLDFQSLQSIDNLANLIQTGNGVGSQIPRSGMKNWSPTGQSSNLATASSLTSTDRTSSIASLSSGNLSSLANSRRLASEGRMESLIRSLSSGNVNNKLNGDGSNANFSNLLQSIQTNTSNANFNSLLQSMQSNLGGTNGSSNSLFGSGASALNLANLLRVDSSTGLTALRMQDGLAARNSSVDDFLSLVASGDIPHQDPHMLNVPLQNLMQQQQQNNQTSAQAAATLLAQSQLLAQAANNGNSSSLGQRIASLNALANNSSAASLLSQYAASHQNSSNSSSCNSQQQARAAQLNLSASALAAASSHSNDSTMKRKCSDDGFSNGTMQSSSKR